MLIPCFEKLNNTNHHNDRPREAGSPRSRTFLYAPPMDYAAPRSSCERGTGPKDIDDEEAVDFRIEVQVQTQFPIVSRIRQADAIQDLCPGLTMTFENSHNDNNPTVRRVLSFQTVPSVDNQPCTSLACAASASISRYLKVDHYHGLLQSHLRGTRVRAEDNLTDKTSPVRNSSPSTSCRRLTTSL